MFYTQKILQGGQEMKLEVPTRKEIEEIFIKYHDKIGHPGINCTVNAIQQRYTWIGINPDVANYVSDR